MNRRLRVLSLALGLALVGCVKSTESTQPRSSDESGTPAQATPPARSAPTPAKPAPAPTPAPSEAPPSAPSSDSSGTDSSGEGSGGGRMAKPGWCKEDSDCPGGQVCEVCEGEKCCVAGCHSDNQCGAGQKCRQVQCIRAPCPGMCE